MELRWSKISDRLLPTKKTKNSQNWRIFEGSLFERATGEKFTFNSLWAKICVLQKLKPRILALYWEWSLEGMARCPKGRCRWPAPSPRQIRLGEGQWLCVQELFPLWSVFYRRFWVKSVRFWGKPERKTSTLDSEWATFVEKTNASSSKGSKAIHQVLLKLRVLSVRFWFWIWRFCLWFWIRIVCLGLGAIWIRDTIRLIGLIGRQLNRVDLNLKVVEIVRNCTNAYQNIVNYLRQTLTRFLRSSDDILKSLKQLLVEGFSQLWWSKN